MVDVSAKETTLRRARARARVAFPPKVLAKVLKGEAPKGGVFGPSRLAGILAAKRTADLIPLCHPIALEHVAVDFRVRGPALLEIGCETKARGRTGVEMEALTGAAVAALTMYDMCKALARGIRIQDVALLEKSGGRSGDYRAEEAP